MIEDQLNKKLTINNDKDKECSDYFSKLTKCIIKNNIMNNCTGTPFLVDDTMVNGVDCGIKKRYRCFNFIYHEDMFDHL